MFTTSCIMFESYACVALESTALCRNLRPPSDDLQTTNESSHAAHIGTSPRRTALSSRIHHSSSLDSPPAATTFAFCLSMFSFTLSNAATILISNSF